MSSVIQRYLAFPHVERLHMYLHLPHSGLRSPHTPAGGLQGDQLRSDLISGMLKYTSPHVIAMIVGTITQVVLARWLGADHFGLYSLAVTVAVLLSYLAGLGLPTNLTRFFPQYADDGDWGKVRGLVRASIRWPLLVSVLAMAVAAVVVLFMDLPAIEKSAILVALLLVPLEALQNVMSSLLQSEKRWYAAFVPAALITPLLFLAAALVMQILLHDLTILHLVAATVGANVVTLAVQMALFFGRRSAEYRAAKPDDQSRMWIVASLPVLLMTLFVIVLTRADLLVIGATLSGSQVGIYAAVLTVAELLELFSNAASSVATPDMAPMLKRGEQGKLQQLLTLVARAGFVPTLIGAIVLFLFGKEILEIFGTGFSAGYAALLILVCAQLIQAASGVPGYLLIMSGNQAKLAQVYAFVVPLDLGLLFLLTPRLGIEGAALASVITTLASRVALNILARRRLHFSTSILAIAPARAPAPPPSPA